MSSSPAPGLSAKLILISSAHGHGQIRPCPAAPREIQRFLNLEVLMLYTPWDLLLSLFLLLCQHKLTLREM